MDAGDPEGGVEEGDGGIVEHYWTNHGDQLGHEGEVGGHIEAGSEVEAYQGGVGVRESFDDVGRIAEETSEGGRGSRHAGRCRLFRTRR